jgi:hypothetical protein
MAAPKKNRCTPPERKAELSDAAIDRVSQGEPLAAVCRDIGLKLSTFYEWMEKDAELSGRFARARKSGFDIIAESLLDIADAPPPLTQQGSTDSGAVQHTKLRIDTRLKLLAKWDPKRYGEKLEVSGDAANPIAIQRIERVVVQK